MAQHSGRVGGRVLVVNRRHQGGVVRRGLEAELRHEARDGVTVVGVVLGEPDLPAVHRAVVGKGRMARVVR